MNNGSGQLCVADRKQRRMSGFDSLRRWRGAEELRRLELGLGDWVQARLWASSGPRIPTGAAAQTAPGGDPPLSMYHASNHRNICDHEPRIAHANTDQDLQRSPSKANNTTKTCKAHGDKCVPYSRFVVCTCCSRMLWNVETG
jgi:hypothetical protein